MDSTLDEFFFELRKRMKINAELAVISEMGQVTDYEGNLLCGSDFENAIVKSAKEQFRSSAQEGVIYVLCLSHIRDHSNIT